MNSIPFIIAENDINLRLVRILVILDKLSYSNKHKPILTLDKINTCDFLLRYPFILHKVIKDNEFKHSFCLKDYEYGNIDSSFPNIIMLFDQKMVNKVLQILLGYDFVSVKEDNGILYIITKSGSEFLNTLSTDYISRIKELSVCLFQIQNISFTKINSMINLAMEGEI